MITKKDLEISNKSYIKKDFYQIYPELLELASKYSSNWNPEFTNESDPALVLLKLLAFIGDKLNYNIDKNVLENYITSCTQENSMRNLCSVLGYNMSYYKSATTTITFIYQGNQLTGSNYFILPAFKTIISNEDESIHYIITKDVIFKDKNKKYEVEAIEGELVEDTINSNGYLQLTNLDDNNRYYLPETDIAENGVFINNIDSNIFWTKVDNLNTTEETTCYKFSFDSEKNLPYIEFCENIASYIKDGLEINYIRTSGDNGNINSNLLNKRVDGNTIYLNNSSDNDTVSLDDDSDGNKLLLIYNSSSSINGSNKETITEAYNSFKKTIGTFNTLVTCRDYENAIYNLKESVYSNNSLLSNIKVTDIKNDINFCNKFQVIDNYSEYTYNLIDDTIKDSSGSVFNNFKLCLYPFNNINTNYNVDNFNQSFKPKISSLNDIKSGLEDNKCINHTFVTPTDEQIFCFKNYIKLSGIITTTSKVNSTEQKVILNNIYQALYKNFNCNKVDFGEEIPYDSIYEVIKNADSNIKNISLDNPSYETKYMLTNGSENNFVEDRLKYIDMTMKNIFAGRLSLFNELSSFNFNYQQSKNSNYDILYGTEDTPITNIKTEFNLPVSDINNYKLTSNQRIKFVAPSLVTKYTYPCYVNYYLDLNDKNKIIKKNEEYQLKNGDKLYINYTDSSENIVNEVYSVNGSLYTYKKYINETLTTDLEFSGIIKPNFELKDSSKAHTEGTSYSKKSGYLSSWGISGMFTLGTNDIVEIRDYVKTVLSDKIKCFWITNDGYIKFTNNEYILKDNEYFFYTNDDETELMTFSSGTKLVYSGESQIYIDYTKYNVNTNNLVSDGLDSFIDIWQSKDFTTLNLTIQEMQFVVLGENDILNNITLTNGETIISNDWLKVSSAEYTLSGDTLASLPILPNNANWEVSTNLILNVGPSDYQTLKTNESITLYNDSTKIKKLENCSFYTSYILQTYTNDIDVTILDTTTNTYINDFKFIVFDNSELNYNLLFNNNYANINFLNDLSYDLNIIVPQDYFALISIFICNKDSSSTITLTSNETNINEYLLNDTQSASVSLNYDGLYTIKVNSSCSLNITSNIKSNVTIYISQSKIVKNEYEGIDYNKLKINPEQKFRDDSPLTEISYLLAILKKYIKIFNCLHTKNNNILMNYESLNESESFYDKNNVLNEFTISQIDTDYLINNLKISNSSKR